MSTVLRQLGAMALVGILILTACQPETVVVETPVKETVVVEKVVKETVVVEKEVEQVVKHVVGEIPEPEEGRVWPADEELEATIRTVIAASNHAHIEALRTLSIDPLLETLTGRWLQFNPDRIESLRQHNQYIKVRLDHLAVTSIGVLEPGQEVVATTIESWSEKEYRNRGDDRLVRVEPPARYYETYFLFFEDGRWKIRDIKLDQQPFLTLVNIVGSVFVNDELTSESREIRPCDTVRTDHDSYASLVYPDGGVTHLGSDTSLELLDMEQASMGKVPGLARPLARGWWNSFRQAVGSTWNNVKKTVFHGVTGRASSLETRFAVHIAEDQSMHVEVFEGVVEVTSVHFPDRPVFVRAGMKTLVRPRQPPLPPVPIGDPWPPDERPDLVVTLFEATGPATFESSGRIALPVRLVIRNQGNTPADVFKVTTDSTGPKGRFLVPLIVPGQAESWYAMTSQPLGAGSEVTLSGKVTLGPDLQGQTVLLRAMADSCAGEEFAWEFCRIDESNEGNNESSPLQVSLPTNRPPVVEIIHPSVDSSRNDPQYAYDGFDQTRGQWYTDVVLQGRATDPEDGVLSGSSLVWTTDQVGIQDALLATGGDATVRLYSPGQCGGIWHVITLTATDSDGNVSKVSRRICIWRLC